MPNGRSAGFMIRKVEFENLLRAFDEHVEIGRSLAPVIKARSVGATPVSLTIAGALAILREFKRSDVSLEGQDHSYDVIHFEPDVEDPDPERWIIVDSTSPLFRRLHE